MCITKETLTIKLKLRNSKQMSQKINIKRRYYIQAIFEPSVLYFQK